LLNHLKDLLDDFHGTTRPIEDYDLLAGDWLLGFSHNIYCAWQEVLAGNVPFNADTIPIITNTRHAQLLTINAGWHQHLRWGIAQLLLGRSSENWRTAQRILHTGNIARPRFSKKLLRSISTQSLGCY